MKFTKPVRVRVRSGDDQIDLGEGTYVGNATVYFFEAEDGSIQSRHNAEEKPLDVPDACQLAEVPDNPKIVLDSGDTVYGCQVWWQIIVPEKYLTAARDGIEVMREACDDPGVCGPLVGAAVEALFKVLEAPEVVKIVAETLYLNAPEEKG